MFSIIDFSIEDSSESFFSFLLERSSLFKVIIFFDVSLFVFIFSIFSGTGKSPKSGGKTNGFFFST